MCNKLCSIFKIFVQRRILFKLFKYHFISLQMGRKAKNYPKNP